MRAIITGSNGKVGRACATLAVSRGWSVLGIDRAGSAHPPCPTLIGDLLDPSLVHSAIEAHTADAAGPIDALIHLANHVNVRSAGPAVVLRENLAMNAAVFTAALQHGIRRLVFCSSIQAFLGGTDSASPARADERPPRLPLDERIDPAPSNTYGLSKLLTERMLDGLAAGAWPQDGESAFSAVSVRLPYVIGDRALEAARERASSCERSPAEYHWGGSEAFAYIHEMDAAEALLAAADAQAAPIAGHEVVWVAADDPRTREDVPALIDRFYQGVPGAEACAARGSFQNTAKARQLLGWSATRTLAAARAQSPNA